MPQSVAASPVTPSPSRKPVQRRGIVAPADEALIQLAREGDETALSLLVDRFRPMVAGMASDRFLPGGDSDDLVQEGMVGLWHAIMDHDGDRGPFVPFARLCVDRQMWGAVTRANRQRHRVLRDATSFQEWMDVADAHLDPAILVQGDEEALGLAAHMKAALSDLEHEVLELYAAGETYDTIAARLEVHRKRIDNALQRARKKILAYRVNDVALAA